MKNKDAIVIAGSKGIGKSIAESLEDICNVSITNKNILNTSNLDSVRKFISINKETDVLVLNTGGPPKMNFFDITEDDWFKYHNQLFLGFSMILQKMKIKKNGFVFLISSMHIKEPNVDMLLSTTYRTAFLSVFKALSKNTGIQNISYINIAPGPIKTDRLKSLVPDLEKLEKSLPMKRIGDPKEIGDFIKMIIDNNIKYLNGATINFDGGISNFLF